MLSPNLLPQKEGISALAAPLTDVIYTRRGEGWRDGGAVVKVNDGRWMGCRKMLFVFKKAGNMKRGG